MCTENKTNALSRIKGGNLYPNIDGTVYFRDIDWGTEVAVEIFGLPSYMPGNAEVEPVGPLAFHVHEYGICQINNPVNPFSTAGGHFNPYNQPHGNHAGDFPVLFSNNGYTRMRFFTDKFKPEDVIGRSVIIHENPDDYRTQPAGNAGKRIACGVICKIE